MKRENLEFANLPTFESSPLFFTLPPDVDGRLRTLSGTYARCNAALRFNSWVGADADSLGVRDEELQSMSVACLRASLMEYAGMEEALGADLPRGSQPLRIRDTRNAMLVCLKELRNVQVHLVRSALRSRTRSAVLRFEGKEHPSKRTVLTIPREDLKNLRDHRNSRAYAKADFVRAVEWLVEAQEHWGITEVIMQGIWCYAGEVVRAHVPEIAYQGIVADLSRLQEPYRAK